MEPPPELIEDGVAEILLRLPPDDPACLIRSSLACKAWRRILSDPGFPGRYRKFHRTPPMLGLLHGEYRTTGHFIPITASIPFLRPEFGGRVPDSLHGRVLFHIADSGSGTWGSLALWNPITGDHKALGLGDPNLHIYNHTGVVFCATAGCDHRECHDGPFLVVFVCNAGSMAFAWVYSSEAASWTALQFLNLGQLSFLNKRRGAVVGDGIYFLLNSCAKILKYDLGKHCLSVIDSPWLYREPIVLMPIEDGSLGLAGIHDSTLHLWSRKVNPTGVATWVQYRTIALEKLLPHYDETYHQANVIGFAEGVDVLFISVHGNTTFMVELKSGRVRNVSKLGYYYDVLPFMRFYIPEFSSSKLTLPVETD